MCEGGGPAGRGHSRPPLGLRESRAPGRRWGWAGGPPALRGRPGLDPFVSSAVGERRGLPRVGHRLRGGRPPSRCQRWRGEPRLRTGGPGAVPLADRTEEAPALQPGTLGLQRACSRRPRRAALCFGMAEVVVAQKVTVTAVVAGQKSGVFWYFFVCLFSF